MNYININQKDRIIYLEVNKIKLKIDSRLNLIYKYKNNRWLKGNFKEIEQPKEEDELQRVKMINNEINIESETDTDTDSDTDIDTGTEGEKELKPLETIEALKIYAKMLNDDERDREIKRLSDILKNEEKKEELKEHYRILEDDI